MIVTNVPDKSVEKIRAHSPAAMHPCLDFQEHLADLQEQALRPGASIDRPEFYPGMERKGTAFHVRRASLRIPTKSIGHFEVVSPATPERKLERNLTPRRIVHHDESRASKALARFLISGATSRGWNV